MTYQVWRQRATTDPVGDFMAIPEFMDRFENLGKAIATMKSSLRDDAGDLHYMATCLGIRVANLNKRGHGSYCHEDGSTRIFFVEDQA